MRKFILMLSILLILLSVIWSPAYAGVTSMSGSDPMMVSEAFDKAIEEVIGADKAKGAVAALIINGEAVLSKGYGYADELLGVAADGSRTGFRVGSVSKTFVALAALIAMENGKLEMDTDISVYLGNDFPKLKYPVTMQHLLTHTGGFEEEITGMVVKNVSDTEPLSVSVRKYMPRQIFKPGEIASYSNYGIALAAYVIECATGEDFADYCRNNVFLPLGMNRTTFAYMHDIVYVSKAYLPDGKETVDLYINLYPEGSAVSIAEDMGRYIQWLLGEDETILSRENKSKLFDRQYSMADEFGGIGYTWNRKTRNGSVYYEKKGETLHFYSRIALYPQQRAGLFLSFNTYVPDKEINAITARVTDLLLGEKERPVSQAGGTIDIGGSYVNAWSSFKTAEKVLRFFVPGKIVQISGSPSKGYSFNGTEITHIGDNAYDTPIGKVKFLKKEEHTLMATDFSQTYVRVNRFENKTFILLITLLFFLSAIILVIQTFKSSSRKKTSNVLPGVMSVLQIISFFVLGVAIFSGVMQYALLSQTLFIHVAAWAIVFATIVNIVFPLVNIFRNGKKPLRYLYLHDIVSLAFCLVIFNLNLLI